MRIRIRSDGTPRGTAVENAATGEPIENVLAIAWHLDAEDGGATVSVTLAAIEAEVEGEVVP